MLATFKLSLSENFQLFRKDQLGGKDTSKEDMSRDLSLLADEELEQNIAASSIARRADTRFSEELFGLMQRLAVLRGGRKLPEDGNPLGANQFAVALQAELQSLKLNIRFTVMFFRVFEKTLLENLGDLYKSANEYLKQQGVLPNLRFGVGLTKTTPASDTKNNGGGWENRSRHRATSCTHGIDKTSRAGNFAKSCFSAIIGDRAAVVFGY